ELESTIRSLVSELKRTQRLINAIDKSILPFYTSSVKFIKSVLDDKSREEFVRLKVVRRLLQKRRENVGI
ncbi:V-type ATP synthase subunit D, partial [Acidianus sp. RZ1]